MKRKIDVTNSWDDCETTVKLTVFLENLDIKASTAAADMAANRLEKDFHSECREEKHHCTCYDSWHDPRSRYEDNWKDRWQEED